MTKRFEGFTMKEKGVVDSALLSSVNYHGVVAAN